MTTTEAADRLEASLKAFQKDRTKAAKKQESPTFWALNDAIRAGLKALGENAEDVETLEARGLFNTPQDEPIPGSYVPGVEQLIRDLRAQ